MTTTEFKLPPLNALRAFEVAARHLNFRLAAQELNVTPSAVAQHVRGIESRLQTQLFDRSAKSLVLTEAGRTYATEIHRAFNLIARATESVKPAARRVTISVTPSFATRWLMPRLPVFLEENPEIELDVRATERVSDLHATGVDLAVRNGSTPIGKAHLVDLLFENVVVAVGNPRLVEKHGLPEHAANLTNFVLLHDSHNLWPEFLETATGKSTVMPNKNIRFNQTSLAIEAAIYGQGIALVCRPFVADELKSGVLMQVFAKELRMGSDFYVVMPRKAFQSPSVALVRDWLLATANSPLSNSGSRVGTKNF